jgi:uncharacterized protein YqeY
MSEKMKSLQADMIAAMKAGDKTRKTILSTLMARAKLAAKNDGDREITDADVVQAVQKTIKEANETKGFIGSGGTWAQDTEIAVVSVYLPQQMTDAELLDKIKVYLADAPEGKAARGYVMKNLQAFKGSFDPQRATAILGELLV